MNLPTSTLKIAIVGAGVAGVACAAGLHRAGWVVRLFDKSHGCGGRMASRRIASPLGAGTVEFDHGAQVFGARHPRFAAVMKRAAAAGAAARWQPRVHASGPVASQSGGWVAMPDMPALCRHLLGDLPVATGQTVTRLQRRGEAWWLSTAEGATEGPFDQVVLALPPAQAAALLVGPHKAWSEALLRLRMEPCWTLMAITDDVDWPWDAAEPERGPLAWVARNDRKPGRVAPPGFAVWVAQASTTWSAVHLEEAPQDVAGALRLALQSLLPPSAARSGAQPLRWHHVDVHRWRYAIPAALAPGVALPEAGETWWDASLGLAVCGDFMGGGGVEAAWRSGDELADTLAARLEDIEQDALVV